jgi:hypothetical protein
MCLEELGLERELRILVMDSQCECESVGRVVVEVRCCSSLVCDVMLWGAGELCASCE